MEVWRTCPRWIPNYMKSSQDSASEDSCLNLAFTAAAGYLLCCAVQHPVLLPTSPLLGESLGLSLIFIFSHIGQKPVFFISLEVLLKVRAVKYIFPFYYCMIILKNIKALIYILRQSAHKIKLWKGNKYSPREHMHI